MFEGNPHTSKRPEKPDFESISGTTEQVLQDLENLPDTDSFSDISHMYQLLPSDELIVRRENPIELLKTLHTREPLQINFVGDSPYANSVVWNPRLDEPKGLDNAYLEGYGHMNGVVMVYGFERPPEMEVAKHPESSQKFGGIDRTRVRTSSGSIPFESIRFVTVRVPILGFPESRMTEEEKDLLFDVQQGMYQDRPVFIYRGFLFGKEKAAHSDLRMAA